MKPEPVRLRAEWETQDAILLSWPHEDTDWRPWLAAIEITYTEMVAAICGFQPVVIVCRDDSHERHIKGLLSGGYRFPPLFYQLPYDDTWCRDYGPLSIERSDGPGLLDFRFSGWGQKYQALEDDRVCRRLAAKRVFAHNPVHLDTELEGGSIETDGAGTLLTTEACLLPGSRNKGMTRQALEDTLRATMGVTHIHWLRNGWLEGDDTDNHIDNLVRFTDPQTLLYTACDNPKDPHYLPLLKMRQELEQLTARSGAPYQLVPLPWPAPQFDEDGRRLPASYANFLILNGAVLVPAFNGPAAASPKDADSPVTSDTDTTALKAYKNCFPGRKIIPIDSTTLIKQYGGVHCATMQLASGTLNKTKNGSAL